MKLRIHLYLDEVDTLDDVDIDDDVETELDVDTLQKKKKKNSRTLSLRIPQVFFSHLKKFFFTLYKCYITIIIIIIVIIIIIIIIFSIVDIINKRL